LAAALTLASTIPMIIVAVIKGVKIFRERSGNGTATGNGTGQPDLSVKGQDVALTMTNMQVESIFELTVV
jgi:hypothetical protein